MIFSEDSGQMSPIHMFQVSDHNISALAWYDASFCPYAAVPVLLIASSNGSLIAFAVRPNSIIARRNQKVDTITSLLWSPYSAKIFYAGSQGGSVIAFELDLQAIASFKPIWELKYAFPIDFISIDPILGQNLCVASRTGRFSIIQSLTPETAKSLDSNLELSDISNRIHFCSFFPACSDFLIVCTSDGTVLYHIQSRTAFQFLALPDVRLIAFSSTCGSLAFIVRSSSVELWDLSLNYRVSDLPLSPSVLLKTPEITSMSFRNDRLLIVTRSSWLTTIREHRRRLFVSNRVKLLDSKPLDWAFSVDQLALATADGKLIITRSTGTRPPKKKKPRPTEPKFVLLPPRSSSFHVGPISLIPKRSPIGLVMSQKQRRNSVSVASRDDLLRVIASEARAPRAREAEMPSPITRCAVKKVTPGLMASIALSFQILNGPLERVEWIAPTRLVVWSRQSKEVGNPVWVVDLKSRRIVHLLGKVPGMRITDVAFSDNRKLWAVIINDFIVSFFANTPEPRHLGSITFKWPVFVTFRSASDVPAILSAKGKLLVAGPVHGQPGLIRTKTVASLARKHVGKLIGTVTGTVYRKSSIYVSTDSGQVLEYQGEGRLSEIGRAKSAIVRLIGCPRGCLVAIDDHQRGYFLSENNEFTQLPTPIRNAVMCGPVSFLVRSRGDGRLKVVRLAGRVKVSFPLHFHRSALMKPRGSWSRLIQAVRPKGTHTELCERFGFPLLLKILQTQANPGWTREQLLVLQQLLRGTDGLLELSLRIALFLGDMPTAENYLRMIDSRTPEFAVAMCKLALFGREGMTSAAETAVSELMDAGFTADAIDLLLIIGNWQRAAQLQLDTGDLMGAVLNARGRQKVDEKVELLREIAERMIGEGQSAFPLLLLAEGREMADVVACFWKADEADQARFLTEMN
jgi:hypothetical protein